MLSSSYLSELWSFSCGHEVAQHVKQIEYNSPIFGSSLWNRLPPPFRLSILFAPLSLSVSLSRLKS